MGNWKQRSMLTHATISNAVSHSVLSIGANVDSISKSYCPHLDLYGTCVRSSLKTVLNSTAMNKKGAYCSLLRVNRTSDAEEDMHACRCRMTSQ